VGLSLVACGAPRGESVARTKESISGGAAVLPGAWPAIAWLDNGCTGVLVAPDMVVFAAHCGIEVTTAWFGDELTIDIDDANGIAAAREAPDVTGIELGSCADFPNWSLASGNDVAYCFLAQTAVDAGAIAPMLFGCEKQAVAAGTDVTLVGFGRDSAVGTPGTKRSIELPIDDVGIELQIGGIDAGTCAGDSGSPAFLALGSSVNPEWRVAGILSTGLVGQACGVGFYANAATVTPWLEDSSGRDLTPCYERDGSLSGSACLEPALDADGLPTSPLRRQTPVCGEKRSERDADCSIAHARGSRWPGWMASILSVWAWRRLQQGPARRHSRAHRAHLADGRTPG
jgi:hypothetical protein